jgi:hypothetical protein
MELNQFAVTDYRFEATKKFPYSKDIRGTGRFALVSKCFRRWRVLLYQTEQSRAAKEQEWFEKGCCVDCRSDHFTCNLSH